MLEMNLKQLFKNIFSAILVLLPALLQAQTATLSGKVACNTGPIAFANVFIKETQLGSSTDFDGRFTIKNIPAGNYILVVSSLGFERVEKSVTLVANGNAVVNFDLNENSATLNEVVISGTMKEVSKLESPVPIEIYTPKFFKSNPTPSIFESLQIVNGVRPQLNCNICNTGDIHINGLEGPYTMILIDGMPIVSGLSTVYGLTGIPQSLVERVEIVKGPASTLYGSEAVGGLVNIITKKPQNAPLFSVDAFGTGWGEINTDIGVRYDLSKKATALLGVNYFNYQLPKDNNNDGFTDVTLQNRISLFNKISFVRKQNRLFSIAARYVYEDRWGGEMDWKKEFRGGNLIYGESIYTSRWETFGLYQLPTKELLNFQFSANGHNQNSAYGNMRYLADQYVAFGQITWHKKLQKHDLLSGLAYRYTYYDDNTAATRRGTASRAKNQPSITHLPGVFMQDEITLNDKNKLLVGVRYDYNSIHGNIFTPRLNYKWTSASKKNILRLSVGNGYRVANVFTEDHAALTGARTVEFDGELQPETSWNANMNFLKRFYAKKGLVTGIDISAFYTYFNNRILPDYESNPNKIIYSNLEGFSVSKGIAFNADMVWPNGFKLLAGGTLMDVTVQENGVAYRQLLTERFSGVWSLGYTFTSIGLKIDYTGNLYGPMRLPLLSELDNRAVYSPWWSLQNIQLTMKFKKGVELYGGVKNLMNYTPPANSIARSFDPFDKQVTFDANGQVVPTANNPMALTFDPSYVFAPNQGIRVFLGCRYAL